MHTIHSRRRAVFVSLGAILLGTTGVTPVFAQSTGGAANGTVVLPPVSVTGEAQKESATGPVVGFTATRSATGTKTDTSLVETPQAISVVTQDEIKARGVTNLKDALSYTPGVVPSASMDLREDLVTFRGFPFDWASFYLDGLQMPSSTYAVSTVDPYGLERVEILKGPASMLYGQSSTGGILNAVSKRPPQSPLRDVELTVGNHNRYQAAGDIGGRFVEGGDLSFRLTGLIRRSETDVEYVRDDRIYIAPAVTWRPTDRTSLTVLASYQYDDLGDSGGTQAFLPASGIALYNPNGKIARDTNGGEPDFDYYKKKQYSVGYEFEHDFNQTWSVVQNLRYRKVEVDYQTAYGTGLDTSDASQRTLTRGAFGSFGGADSISVDTRVQANWKVGAVANTTVLGVDYRRTTVDERNYFGAGPSIDIFSPVYGAAIALPAQPYADQTIKSRQMGVYVQNQARILERWLVTLGGRWDRAELDVTERTYPYAFTTTDYALTGRAGLGYLFDNGVAPYVSAATSFNPVLEPNAYGAPFEPRTGRQYEAGVKYQPPGSNNLFTAAVFHLTQQNVLTDDPDQVNHPFGKVQTGEYRSRGLELEAKVSLTQSLRMIGSYTYVDAEYTESNTDNLGNAPKGIPRHAAALWLDYAVPEDLVQGLSVAGGARYVGERPNTDTEVGRFMQPSYTLFDAAIRYNFRDSQLALNVNNLFDKEYYDCWGARCWYGQGRTVLLTLRHSL